MEIIKYDQFIKMPWKNGGGSTLEILLSPKNAKIDERLFNFRISMASIEEDGDFSIFPNRSRILTIIKGNGVLLNNQELRDNNIYTFSGDNLQKCKLISGPVLDFGVIYNPINVNISMIYCSDEITNLDFNSCNYYVYPITSTIGSSYLCTIENSSDLLKIRTLRNFILIKVISLN